MRVKLNEANAAKPKTKKKWFPIISHRKVMTTVGTADSAMEESWMTGGGEGGNRRGGEGRRGDGRGRGEGNRGGERRGA